LCPDGWYVQSDSERHQLVLIIDPDAILSLDENQICGGKIKEPGYSHRKGPNVTEKNESTLQINLMKKKTKILAIMVGFLSLVWFLIRVIPKPSRAAYPCQRAAFPMASAFILWITGALSGKYFFKKARNSYSGANPGLIVLFIFLSIISFSVITLPFSAINASFNSSRSNIEDFKPTDNPNTPIGKAKGIFPGRVVWCYNPNATDWNGITKKGNIDGKSGATSPNPEGNWFLEGNIIQSQVDLMISETVCRLTGKNSDILAWDAIFKYFNITHLKGATGYKQGEKIAVKINLNNCTNHGTMNGATNISPQMVLGLLRQLVYKSNVPAGNITFYDVSRAIPSTIYNLCKKEFPDVKFVDQAGGDGRIKGMADIQNQITWSQELVLEPLANPSYEAYLPTCVTEAEYIINLANLKGHTLAGVSLCSKNMFGSFIAPNSSGLQPPQAAGIHPYIAVKNSEGYNSRPMKSYNSLVDLMGNKNLGGKTLIFFVDGLFAAPWQNAVLENKFKWQSSPFNGNWTSSLFASLDNVAIESVCLDFLRTEQEVSEEMKEVTGNVDNYLHEAALADNPPSGTYYHPNGNSRLNSLGVHEHWNNAQDKKYTRNLGSGNGIELVSIVHTWGSTAIDTPEVNERILIYPNPAQNLVNIKLPSQITGDVKLELFSFNGTLIFKEFIRKEIGQMIYQIDINSYKGMLVLKISVDSNVQSDVIISY
jgi:hypothetical protein